MNVTANGTDDSDVESRHANPLGSETGAELPGSEGAGVVAAAVEVDDVKAAGAEALSIADEMGASVDQVREHLARMPSAYAERVAPRTIVRHTLLLSNLTLGTVITTRVAPASGDTTIDELDVVGADRPGLFAKVAGVVALNGGAIVAAEAFARDDGTIVDMLRVRPPEGAGGSWWARVEGDLEDAAAGRLAVRARVAAMARSEDDRIKRLGKAPTNVTVTGSTIEVEATDRLGVLYAITSALAELDVDIVSARVGTDGQMVFDQFVVRNLAGEPIDDDHAAEIALAVHHAVENL